jgi:hypothetical protein
MRARIVACATAVALAVALPTALAKPQNEEQPPSSGQFWMCIEAPVSICIPNLLDDIPLIRPR